MTLAVLEYSAPNIAIEDATASAFRLSQSELGRRVRELASMTAFPLMSRPTTFSERLAAAMRETESAIRSARDYLGPDRTNALIARTRAIFRADEWPEEHRLPVHASITSTLQAVASIGGEPSLGVSQAGNLTATWQNEGCSLSIEGTASRKLEWAYVIEEANDFVLLEGDQSTLAELLDAIDGR